MAVPKRRQSRANTHARRSQWKASAPTLVKTVENGKVVYSLPHPREGRRGLGRHPPVHGVQGRKVADV